MALNSKLSDFSPIVFGDLNIIPRQFLNSHTAPSPIPYTGSPLLLCLADIRLFFSLAWSLPGILIPVTRWRSSALDELYPSLPNLISLALHGFLIIFQSLVLLSLPFLILLPLWGVILYLAAVYAVTWITALLLNGTEDVLHSTVDLGEEGKRHAGECWIYLNGVSIGKHWLQSNLDRLAYTFRRPITGVHNRTYGILFDLLQCIVERDFDYATYDIRRSYVTIKNSLLDEKNKKVVLILHSQGGIEGSLILDWLLTELPHDTVNKLEIYSFGSAANHFNNPLRHSQFRSSAATNGDTQIATSTTRNHYAVRHIEHYAAAGEFVARWGVLHFAPLPSRYAGRVFIRPGTGHLLNQHYLNSIFPLDQNMRVREHNSFMDMNVRFTSDGAMERVREGYVEMLLGGEEAMDGAIVKDRGNGVSDLARSWPVAARRVTPRVRDCSRLWLYRNGGSPED
ncbi:hypothetical protein BU23DRAFT_503818, partial [Bimuria novae-zelandiae CBS 107.79]